MTGEAVNQTEAVLAEPTEEDRARNSVADVIRLNDPADLQEFLEAIDGCIEPLEEGLLVLEGDPKNPEPVETLFRSAHTVKGVAGFMQYGRLEMLAHRMENVLAEIRKGTVAAEEGIITSLLRALDGLKSLVMMVRRKEEDRSGDYAVLVRDLEGIVARAGSHAALADVPDVAGPGRTEGPQDTESPAQAEAPAGVIDGDDGTDRTERRLLLFRAGPTIGAFPVESVASVERVAPTYRVPFAGGYTQGVSNLRGEIIPVLDLNARLGFRSQRHDRSRMVVLSIPGGSRVAWIVDEVMGIRSIPLSDIQAASEVCGWTSLGPTGSVARFDGSLVFILNTADLLREGPAAP